MRLSPEGRPRSRRDPRKCIDPVLRPSYITAGNVSDTVIIDPGHGGHDSGARGIYGYEKDFVLKLGLQLKVDLEKRGLTEHEFGGLRNALARLQDVAESELRMMYERGR